MLRHPGLLGFVVLLAGCSGDPHSPAGFRLASNGDATRGKQVFLELHCVECHQVADVNLSVPMAQDRVPVVLGGEVDRQMADGYLVTAIINPSFVIARRYPADQMTKQGKSRMPNYEELTVRELTDLVAFLQSHYRVRKPPQTSFYH
jgi:mono/diheme cytochrome c family protein